MKNVIYKIRNVVNGNFYVGSTVDSRKRFWAHRKALRTNKHDCIHLQRSWNKHGEDCFKFEVIEQYDTREELYPAEQLWLNEHFGKDYCYNVSANADSPMRNATPEMRLHLAEKTKEWLERDGHPRQGLTWSNEHRRQISDSRKGKHAGESHYRYGKSVSEEVRKKIGDTQRGVKKTPRLYTEEGLKKAQENMRRNATKQEVKSLGYILNTFPQNVLDKYDFSNAEYTGASNRMMGCVCPNHGEFTQYSAQFRKGKGCPLCGSEKRAESKREQMKKYWGTGEGREMFIKSRSKKSNKINLQS